MSDPRVLIVDDHALYRKGLRSMFELESDMEVVGEANGGVEAIDMVEQLHPDIVLMDVNMPVMDGVETVRRMRAIEAEDDGPATRVVALSANAFADDRATCLAAGMNDYITKPMRVGDIEAALKRWDAVKRSLTDHERPASLHTG